jgi:hypothetical protein
MAKKAPKKKTTKKSGLLPQIGLWFEKDFPGPLGSKRRLIEAFYRGYLHAYNENGGSGTKYYIPDDPDGFIWERRGNREHLKVYITPPPSGPSDPPVPGGPPPPKIT